MAEYWSFPSVITEFANKWSSIYHHLYHHKVAIGKSVFSTDKSVPPMSRLVSSAETCPVQVYSTGLGAVDPEPTVVPQLYTSVYSEGAFGQYMYGLSPQNTESTLPKHDDIVVVDERYVAVVPSHDVDSLQTTYQPFDFRQIPHQSVVPDSFRRHNGSMGYIPEACASNFAAGGSIEQRTNPLINSTDFSAQVNYEPQQLAQWVPPVAVVENTFSPAPMAHTIPNSTDHSFAKAKELWAKSVRKTTKNKKQRTMYPGSDSVQQSYRSQHDTEDASKHPDMHHVTSRDVASMLLEVKSFTSSAVMSRNTGRLPKQRITSVSTSKKSSKKRMPKRVPAAATDLTDVQAPPQPSSSAVGSNARLLSKKRDRSKSTEDENEMAHSLSVFYRKLAEPGFLETQVNDRWHLDQLKKMVKLLELGAPIPAIAIAIDKDTEDVTWQHTRLKDAIAHKAADSVDYADVHIQKNEKKKQHSVDVSETEVPESVQNEEVYGRENAKKPYLGVHEEPSSIQEMAKSTQEEFEKTKQYETAMEPILPSPETSDPVTPQLIDHTNYFWPEEDINFLKHHFEAGNKSFEWIAKRLKKTHWAVKLKLRRMIKKEPKAFKRKWVEKYAHSQVGVSGFDDKGRRVDEAILPGYTNGPVTPIKEESKNDEGSKFWGTGGMPFSGIVIPSDEFIGKFLTSDQWPVAAVKTLLYHAQSNSQVSIVQKAMKSCNKNISLSGLKQKIYRMSRNYPTLFSDSFDELAISSKILALQTQATQINGPSGEAGTDMINDRSKRKGRSKGPGFYSESIQQNSEGQVQRNIIAALQKAITGSWPKVIAALRVTVTDSWPLPLLCYLTESMVKGLSFQDASKSPEAQGKSAPAMKVKWQRLCSRFGKTFKSLECESVPEEIERRLVSRDDEALSTATNFSWNLLQVKKLISISDKDSESFAEFAKSTGKSTNAVMMKLARLKVDFPSFFDGRKTQIMTSAPATESKRPSTMSQWERISVPPININPTREELKAVITPTWSESQNRRLLEMLSAGVDAEKIGRRFGKSDRAICGKIIRMRQSSPHLFMAKKKKKSNIINSKSSRSWTHDELLKLAGVFNQCQSFTDPMFENLCGRLLADRSKVGCHKKWMRMSPTEREKLNREYSKVKKGGIIRQHCKA